MKAIVTGTKGFIGTHLVRRLVDDGVTVFETSGDVLLRHTWDNMLFEEADVLIHLAARVGTGESMYRVSDYCSNNVVGTAVLLEQAKRLGVKRIVLASSSAVYSDSFAPLSEQWRPEPSSVYGTTKLAQENLVKVSGIPWTILRLFCVYGQGQSLKNPYSGIVGGITAALLSNAQPILYEDGDQTRDFVHIDDVVRAFLPATIQENWLEQTLNIGTGIPTSMNHLVAMLRNLVGGQDALVLGRKRVGDMRHAVANIEKVRRLGWSPQVSLVDGLVWFAEWASDHTDLIDAHALKTAYEELEERGLVAPT